jgi:hypothetical protein
LRLEFYLILVIYWQSDSPHHSTVVR